MYSDPVSVVFLRRVPCHAAGLARFRAGEFVNDPAPPASTFPAVARATLEPPSDPPSMRMARAPIQSRP